MKWNYAVCHYYYMLWDFFLNYREREREKNSWSIFILAIRQLQNNVYRFTKKKNFCKYHKYTSYLIKVETPSLIKSLISCSFLWKKSSRSEPQMINDLNAMIRIKWVNRRRNQSRDRTR